MNGFIAFLTKETLEMIRNFKIWILLGVFLLFGMMSPLLAKIFPEILSGMEMEGMVIALPEATYLDAYAQLFKNISQLGYVILLLIFGGILQTEVTKGTLTMILAKGLPRRVVLLSKYTMAIILWTVSLFLGSLTALGYTAYLFDDMKMGGFFFALFSLWLFGCFMIALLLFSSTIARGGYGGLIITVSILFLLLIANMIPKVNDFNPITLAQDSLNLVKGTIQWGDRIPTISITLGSLFLLLFASIKSFKKMKL